jgi:hypothetical protein
MFATGLVTAGVVAGAGPLAVLSDSTPTETTTAADPGTSSVATTTDTTSTDTSTTADTTSTDTTDTTPTTESTSTTTETTPTPSGPPTIASDQPDYAPGSTVILTGANWAAGEAVHLFVNDDVGQTWAYNADVTADASGSLTNQFQLPTYFVATYRATATGSTGRTASTTFTDGNLRFSYAPSAVGNFTDSWTKYTNNTCTTTGGSAPTSGSGTVTNNPGGTLSAGAVANEWIKITAPATVGSYSFSSWSGPSSFSSTSQTICVPGFAGNGNDSYVMNFTLVTVQPTSLTVAAVSGTFAGTASLSATLTSGGSGVSGKSINFTLNGAAAGSATTNGSGVATLGGVSLSGIDAGTYNPGVNSGVAASFAGDSGYSASSGSNTLTVGKAASTTTVTCPASVPYNGSAQTPCSATVAGAGGLSLTPTPSYSNNTNAGTATASYTYVGDTNHTGSSDSKNFTIDRADPHCSVTAYHVTYDGDPHTASGSCTGVGGGELSGLVLSGTTHTDAGDYAGDPWSFAQTTNYNAASGTVHDQIDRADLDISAVTDSKPYDGNRDSGATPSVSGLQGTDTVTGKQQRFQSKNVLGPNGSTLEVTAYTVNDGNSGGNYDVHLHTATGTITPKTLTVSFQAQDKVWDGNPNATIKSSPAPSLVGVVSGDNVTLGTGTASATFASSAVGTWTVTGIGFTKGGSDAGNYVFASAQDTTTASILAWSAQGRGFYPPVGLPNSIFTAAPGTAPLSNPGEAWNTAKGGSTVPLKFNVYAGTVEKTSLSDIKSFQQSKLASCAGGAAEDPVEDTPTTGGTTLRYDGTGAQWIQNWATPKVTSDTCYRAWVTFADGSSLEAFFKLRK